MRFVLRIAPVLIVLIGCGLFGIALAFAGDDAVAVTARDPAPPRPVLVATVRLEPLAPTHTLPGTIRARTESDLGFRIGGKLLRRLVDAGAVVVPGQAIAELDPVDLMLQVRQAEADLNAAITQRSSAAAELSRVVTLRGQGWSTAADYDRQKAGADDAAGKADRAAHALTLARNALGYGTLRADAAGVVTATSAEPGQVVTAGQTVVRLARLDEKEAAVAIPEALLEDARAGHAEVTLWALPGRHFAARLRELTPNADSATRTYPARFSIEDADADVMLGMTATVAISMDPTMVARLPLSAILDEGQGPQVWVVDGNGTLEQRRVTVTRYGERDAIVTAGLADGDRIVTMGVQKLSIGQRVRPMDRLPS
jgi:RND family efflux transporter MFP subunit